MITNHCSPKIVPQRHNRGSYYYQVTRESGSWLPVVWWSGGPASPWLYSEAMVWRPGRPVVWWSDPKVYYTKTISFAIQSLVHTKKFFRDQKFSTQKQIFRDPKFSTQNKFCKNPTLTFFITKTFLSQKLVLSQKLCFITKAFYHKNLLSHKLFYQKAFYHNNFFITKTFYHKSFLSQKLYITQTLYH